MQNIDLYVNEDGSLQLIFDDDAVEIFAADGVTTTRRVSFVEPAPDGRGWCADLAPVGGPVLGPFARRGDALTAEVAYLAASLEAGQLTVQS